jgi:hypothetical protein
MSVPYATFAEFTMVYCFNGVSEAAINSYWLFHGSGKVNEALGHLYTTPFSSNNWTAKDLTIHYAALGILVRTLKVDDSVELKKELDGRVMDITSGGHFMTSDLGVILEPDKDFSKSAWSSTKDYEPTFNMLGSEEQFIDPDRLEDEYDALD